MNTIKVTKSIILCLLAVLLIFSCKKEENTGPELIARTGADTTSSIGDTVWLDASASSGTDYEILWTFHSQPGDDTITLSNSDSAYFVPMFNGVYQVHLTITKGTLFNSDYQNIVVSGAVRLDDEISSATRLKKIAGVTESDYIAMAEVAVSGDLVVDPGVIIEFKNNASLVIKEGGTIYADNASFIAAESNWKGICLKTSGNSFANCVIDNAGNASFTEDPAEKAAIIMVGDAAMAFSGNTLSSSGGYGLVVKENANFFFDSDNQIYAYRNNRFIKNALGPMVIPVHVLNDLSGQNFEEETADTYIEIYGSSYPATASKDPWFSNQGMAYKVTGTIEFNRDLTINNGVEMYFEQDAGIKVSGKLTVSGTSEYPVVMDGVSSSPASWQGIYVRLGQVDLSYLRLLNAGNALFTGVNEKAALIVEELLSMKNSTISGSGGIGIYMPGDAHIQYSDNFTGNTLENNAISAIRIRMDDVSKVVSGNTFRTPDSSVPAVEVHMGLDDQPGIWVNLETEYDYKIIESLTIKATRDLVIEAGTKLKMSVGTTLEVAGGLQAEGTAGSKITFEGTESKMGHWDGIFLKGSYKVELDHLVIRDGGGDLQDKANLIVESTATDVSLTNSSLTNSKGYGVLIKSGASDFGINDPVSNNTLEGNLGGFHKESK